MNGSGRKKTLADLKRDAKAGTIRLELIERFGKTGEDIPETLRGIRDVARVNSVSITLRNEKGAESELRFSRASLIDYGAERLAVYRAGLRELTDQERDVLAGEQKIREDYSRNNPYGDPYWRVKEYYRASPCPWMYGYGDPKNGKLYRPHEDKVSDQAVKGELILLYRVHAA